MKKRDPRPSLSVLEYFDFRKYLADWYAWRKGKGDKFSYRAFCKLAGATSSGLYLEVCNGKRNLTRTLILRFSRAIGHSEREAEYFENLVLFNQSHTVDERNRYFSRMARFFRTESQLLQAERLEYYSSWYYVAIRELLATGDYGDDYPRIACALRPAIRPHDAKRAVKMLTRLKLIRKDARGFHRPVDVAVTTGPEVRSLSVANFQRATLALAKEAIDRFPADFRDISTLTLSVTHPTYQVLKSEIISFRQRLLAMASKEKNPRMVCQVNLQLFPMTVVPGVRARRGIAKEIP